MGNIRLNKDQCNELNIRRGMVRSDVLTLPGLSWQARMILAHQLLQADDFKLIPKALSNKLRIGVKRIYAAIKELEEKGYIQKKESHNRNGKLFTGREVDYQVLEMSSHGNGHNGDFHVGSFHQTQLNNTNLNKSKLNISKLNKKTKDKKKNPPPQQEDETKGADAHCDFPRFNKKPQDLEDLFMYKEKFETACIQNPTSWEANSSIEARGKEIETYPPPTHQDDQKIAVSKDMKLLEASKRHQEKRHKVKQKICVPNELKADYDEVLNYLNQKTNQGFGKRGGEPYKKLIERLKINTKEECKEVIDKMTPQWIGQAKTKAWLNPDTLFGDKFTKYLESQISIYNKKLSFTKEELKISDAYDSEDDKKINERALQMLTKAVL